jgi:hypothetical protein
VPVVGALGEAPASAGSVVELIASQAISGHRRVAAPKDSPLTLTRNERTD